MKKLVTPLIAAVVALGVANLAFEAPAFAGKSKSHRKAKKVHAKRKGRKAASEAAPAAEKAAAAAPAPSNAGGAR